MSTSSLTAFCDATILTGEATVEGHALLARGGIIVDIVANRHVPAEAHKIACPGQILAPGLIDAQVNGGGNLLLNNEPTAATCLAIAKAHRGYGTTGLLLTCISDTPEITRSAIAAVREARKTDKGILGIHLEGPHLGMEKRGVHSAASLRALGNEDIEVYRREGDEVLLITLAPETVPADQIKALSQQAVISLGHTSALPEQIHAALEAGATGFTHLYNGMGGMSARTPGVAGVALDDRNSWCGIIADGHHVAPELIRLALRAKPQGKLFLISDAMPPAATDKPQAFKLYGKSIYVEDHEMNRRNSGSVPSPLWGGLGWGARRLASFIGIRNCLSARIARSFQLQDKRMAPHPNPPHKGGGFPPALSESYSQYPKCITTEGNLAGSAITLLDAVRYCVQVVGIELDEALRMASTYPAAFLGVDKKLGKLLPGYKTDVIALNERLELNNNVI